jgi:SAM-dependent methyltransferase
MVKNLLVARPDESNDFDAEHGTDTREIIKVYKLDSVSSAYIHSHGYDACDIARLRRDLSFPAIAREKYEFIDIGCGKGRALIFAAEMGFGKVTGVEISPMLSEIAAKNLKICGIDGTIVTQDAGTFVIPENPCVCYLYDPFGKPVMKKFVANIENRLKRSAQDLWIIYRGPLYSRILESCPALEMFEQTFDTAFYRARMTPTP